MLICYLTFRFYSWLEATETNLIRSSLSLLIQASVSRAPFTSCILLYIRLCTFPTVSPSSVTHHNCWNIYTVFSPCFLEFPLLSCSTQKLGCPRRTLPVQKPLLFFLSSVFSPLDLEMGRGPPHCLLFSFRTFSLPPSLPKSQVISLYNQVPSWSLYHRDHSQLIWSLAHCQFTTTFLI